MRIIGARRLTADAWAPFGWMPMADTDPADGDSTLEFAWSDPHLNVIAHARDEVEWIDGRPVCRGMYRHDSHTQALMPIDESSVIAVARADLSLDDGAGAADAVAAFRLEPLDVVVLGRGTWHWGPFPVTGPSVRLLNVQGRGYRDDNTYGDLAALDASVAIDLADRADAEASSH